MTLAEIQAANEAADAERVAAQQGETIPVASEKTPEQLAEEQKTIDEAKAVEARKQLVVEAVKVLIEDLVEHPDNFTTGELGWATDAFSTLLKIRATKTAEHEEFAKVNQEAQDKFYAIKMKDLTPIEDEISTSTTQTA